MRAIAPTALALVSATLLALALVPVADAAPKRVADFFGSTGTSGGQFGAGAGPDNAHKGIAINETGAGVADPGDVYVADAINHRIQQFSSDGEFVRAFGQDVHGVNERQQIVVTATAGTFTLSLGGETTAPIAFNASGAGIASALAALPSVGPGNVAGSGFGAQPRVIAFQGSLAGTDVAQLTADTTGLTGSVEIETLVEGAGGPSAGFETCADAALCQAGSNVAKTGGAMSQPQSVAVDQVDGSVYVLDSGNLRVQKFTAGGDFVWAVGQNVLTGGPVTGTVVCSTAASCKSGTSGTQGGAFASTFTGQVAVDPTTRNVYVTDPGARRVQQFTAGGAFVRAFGFDVDAIDVSTGFEVCTVASECKAALTANALSASDGRFTNSQPTRVAVDASGDVYTVEQNQQFRVQKFSPFGAGLVRSFFAPLELNGNSTANDAYSVPTDVAVDAGTQNVLVSRTYEPAFTSPCPSGAPSAAERRVLELDSSGTLLESHMACAAIDSVNGLAVRRSDAPDDTAGSIYVSSTTGDRRIFRLDSVGAAPPTVAVDPATGVGGHGATLNGEIALNESPGQPLSLGWRFEYSKNGATWTPAPATNATIAAGTPGTVTLPPQAIGGLEANRTYRVRLVATKQHNAAHVVSAESTFDTPASPLEGVTTLAPDPVRTTAVRLRGSFNPNNEPSTYHFEYGVDAGYGSRTPAAVASGGKTTVATRWLRGLEPATTYHYRIVVSNPLSGTVHGADHTFTTSANRGAPLSPSGRAYEMVSPPEKNGGGKLTGINHAVASSGDAAAFCNMAGFGDPPPRIVFVCAGYVSHRGDDGWRTIAMPPASCGLLGGEPYAYLSPATFEIAVSRRGSHPDCPAPPLNPDAPLPSADLFRLDMRGPAPAFGLLAPEAGSSDVAAAFADGTDDFGTVVYTSRGQLTPDAPAGAFDKVFAWTDDGSLSLVSRDASNAPLTTPSAVADPEESVNGLSADGDRVFFQNPVNPFTSLCNGANCELRMRDGGAATHWVSEQECTVACSNTAAADVFEWATSDGSKALFLSAAKLTDDATFVSGQSNLYRYTHSANPASDNNLTLVSVDDEPADGTTPGVLGVSGISDDGDTIFFVANGQLVAGASTAAGPKLYRWRWNGGASVVEHLATLDPNAAAFDNPDGYAWRHPAVTRARSTDVVVTPNGDRMIMQTVRPLEPAVDLDSALDVYRWDEDEGWRCLSCQPPGEPSAGPSSLQGGAPNASDGIPVRVTRQRIVMVDDGDRVFFTSHDPLVPGDVNGGVRDVYEWNDGELSLISNGTGTYDVHLSGASASGDDVFFVTDERLVGWDIDSSTDLYDARVGGGFPEPPAQAPPCEAGACQGSGADAAPVPAAGTVEGGDGNAGAGRRWAISIRRPSLAQRRRAARSGRLVISVRGVARARVVAAARARIGQRVRRVGRGSVRMGDAGRARLRLRLSRLARRRLEAGRALRLRVRVTSPGARARALTVRLPGARS